MRDYALKLDHWTGPIVVSPDEIERRTRDVPQAVKDDIDFAAGQVRRFADAQRDSVHDSRLEIVAGLARGPAARAGQRRRLLRADRPLRAYRLGLHVDRDRQGGGRADRHRLLDAVQGRGHPSARALRDEGRGRRRRS